MKGRFWNTAAIALLALIAALVYFMPRFNYDLLVRRQAQVESGLNTILGRMEKVESVVEVGSEKRSAALKALDGLPERLGEVQEKLSEVSDQTALALGELVALDGRMKALEEGGRAETGDDDRASNQDLTRWARPDYTRPITLPPELEAKARKLSPGITADLQTPDFIDKLLQAGIVAGERVADLPPTLTDRLHYLNQIYKANITLLNASQEFYVHQEIERMTREGRFVEVPAASGPVREAMGPDEVGIRHTQVFHETGLQRVFMLHIEEHPRIVAFNQMRVNVRDHLVLDAARMAGSLGAGEAPAGGPR